MYTLRDRYYNPKRASFCNLNEGLIHSYDMEKCESDLKSRFSNVLSVINHSTNKYRLPMWKDESARMGNFEIKMSSLENLKSICKVVEDVYGWFPAMLEVNGIQFIDWKRDGSFVKVDGATAGTPLDYYIYMFLKGNVESVSLFVEAKFTTEDFDIKELYHVTDGENLPKIKKYGLVPKTKGNFTERVYFGKNLEDIMTIFEDRFQYPITLRLNFGEYGKEIRDKYIFYKDPRMDGAVFTYDCIDPKYIQILDERSLNSIYYKFNNII